jgi:hypothetical protein
MTRCAWLVFDVSLQKRRLVPVSRFWFELISDLTPSLDARLLTGNGPSVSSGSVQVAHPCSTP